MEYPEDVEIEKLDTRRTKIVSAVSGVQERGQAAARRIQELQKGLGEIVLRAAMGEVSPDEPRRIRLEIQGLRDAVEDAELVVEVERVAGVRIGGERQRIGLRRDRRAEYEALKAKITEAGATQAETSRLRDLASALGVDSGEVDALLASPRAA